MYTKCSTFNEMKQIPPFHNNKRSSSSSNSSNSNVQQRRKRFCQTIQYSPIVDATEHDTVGEILCSAGNSDNNNNNNENLVQNAITKVLIWKNRVVSQHIAHALDCTVSIVQVLQRDLRKDHPGPVATITTNELRHLYSNIIVRCINGFADVLQQQRSVATSIAILCQEIGIPKYIVTIRHEATHNHLPSLSTLRIVAKTLLDYIRNVYWIPMQQEHTLKPCQRAREALQYYEMAIQQHQLEQVEKQKREQLQHEQSTVNSMDNNDDEEQDDDDEDEIIMDGLFQSIPGTTSNRFAALIDATKKSTTKLRPPPPKLQQQQHQHLAIKGEMKIPPRKKQKTDRTGISPTTNTTNHERLVDHGPRPQWFSLATCAKAYMTPNESVSIDILQRVAIEHILTQTKHYVASANHSAISSGDKPNNNGRPEKQSHTIFLRRYRPLLGSIARVWPGFCSRFISYCLQEIIQLESFWRDKVNGQIHVHDHPSDCDPLLYGILLEGWIHLFFSNNFLLQIDVPPTMVTIPIDTPSNNNDNSIQNLKRYNAIASSLIFKSENCIGKLDLFRKLQYPLNRWCDQLFETSSSGPDAPKRDDQSDSVPGRITELLVSRLGDERTPLCGVPPPRTVQQSGVVTVEINNTTTDCVVPTRKSKTMSLEDMEAFLLHKPVADPPRHRHDDGDDDTSGRMTMNDDNNQRRRSNTIRPFRNWVSCPTWEPCAIGTTFW